MTALEAKLEERATARASVLGLRRELAELADQRIEIDRKIVSTRRSLERSTAALAQATNEAAKLLHADLAGVAGSGSVPIHPDNGAPVAPA